MHLTMIATRNQSCRFKYYSYISCQTKLALNGRRKNLYTTKHEQPPTMADIFHRASIVAELLRRHFSRLVCAILQAHSSIVSPVTFQFVHTRTHLRRHCGCVPIALVALVPIFHRTTNISKHFNNSSRYFCC